MIVVEKPENKKYATVESVNIGEKQDRERDRIGKAMFYKAEKKRIVY